MDDRRLFVLIVAASLLLASMLVLAHLAEAQPALAAGGSSPLVAAGFSPELDAIPHIPIEPAAGPGSVRPPAAPYPGPLLQGTSSLTVTKSAEPSPVNADGVLTYTIVVTNGGTGAITDATITDTLDNNVSFASASGGGTHDSGVVTWEVGVIPMGQTITRTLSVTVSHVPDGTMLSNTVAIASTGGLSDTNTITTPVTTAADLAVTKSGPPYWPAVNFPFDYTVTVRNDGPSAATGVVLTDTLPIGMFYAGAIPSVCSSSNGTTVICNLDNISSGEETQFAIRVNPTEAGIFTNRVVVAANERDTDPTDNTATEKTMVQPADLSVAKSDSPDPVLVGAPLEYTLTVANAGPNLARNVVLVDRLPSGVIFRSSTPGAPTCSHASGVVTCNLGNMPNLGSTSVRIIVEPTVTGPIVNRAEVSAKEPDPDTTDNEVTEATTVDPRTADLGISKSDSDDPVVAGTSFAYGLTITNHGPFAASEVRVSDTLPAGLAFNAAGSSENCSATSQDVTCLIGDFPVNDVVSLTIAVSVDASLPAGTVLINTANVSGDEVDPNQDNDADTEDTLVLDRFRTYLPMFVGPTFTELSVFNDNTGGNVTFTVFGTAVSCSVPNNTTRFCGSFPAGTYNVKVTSACGDGVFPKTYAGGPVTTRVFCN